MEELYMAKVEIQGLDEAIEEISKHYKRVIKSAAEEAIEEAKNDLHANAVSCLVEYYNDYKPTSYSRTYSLINSFVPYASKVKEHNNLIVCSAGVEFDPSKIQGMYDGSDRYSNPDGTDADWIISNFLAGIHPRTDGSSILGGGNYEYEVYYGTFVPAEEMQRYINRYYDTFDSNLRRAISKQVLKTIKK